MCEVYSDTRYRLPISILSSHGTYRLTASKSRRRTSSWLIRIYEFVYYSQHWVREWLIHIKSACKTESSKEELVSHSYMYELV